METLITILTTLFVWQTICCLVHQNAKGDTEAFEYFFVIGLLYAIFKPIAYALNVFNTIKYGIAVCYNSPCKYFIYTRNPFKAHAIKKELKKRHNDSWYLRYSNLNVGSCDKERRESIKAMKKHQYDKARVFYA